MIPKVRVRARCPGSFDLRSGEIFLEGSELAALGEKGASLGALFAEELGAVGLRVVSSGVPTRAIVFRVDEKIAHPEGYELRTTPERIEIVARTSVGLFYGSRTILVAARAEGSLEAGVISDEPRFAWRGAHLDVARHFFPVEFIKRFIDVLALHKLNVFHWHLTEDQGWRIQIDSYPKLCEVSAFRKGETGSYGGFYTKDEVREVVRYAEARSVTVVPEIEMPGHALAVLAAYPELSCTGGPFEVETRWGIFDDVFCAGSDAVFEFLERVIDEVIELFPAKYFHIGGDECPKGRWKECSRCQARMSELGLVSEDELQSWFVQRMSHYLAARDRRLVGWDEILEGGLAKGATVMSWRGTAGGVRAAKMGHDVVMSPTSHCYLDYKQAPDEEEPGAWFAPPLELRSVYFYEPVPEELTEKEACHVLGVQGNVWTERMPTAEQVEYMTYPRLSALAEVAWSGPERDYEDFQERLSCFFKVLDQLGVKYRGSASAKPLKPSAEEQAQYARAKAERAKRGAVSAAYT